MLNILKNDTKLDIKNVICFYVGNNVPDQYEVMSKKKKEDWSYQDYLTECCHNKELNLVWVNKATVYFYFENDTLSIYDGFSCIDGFSIDKKNIHDTIIFQGQANDHNQKNLEGLMRAMEYMGFFMLNTYDEIRLASDKYLTANLLTSHHIPQPNYCLITKETMENLDTECHDTRPSFWEMIHSIYKEASDIDNRGSLNYKPRKYVVKILNGSLGIGVFICDEGEIEGILQCMFEVDKNIEFIVQEFKENTGDIRVHALSIDGINYEILACMKRDKIEKDFRSNVSLGAKTEEYELTDKQKEIVMHTAIASGCRWVGIDLMACEDGDDVVIEYNSSPGVQGISRQIGKNMFEIVIDKIQKFMKKNAIYHTDKFEFGQDKGECHTIYNPDTIQSLIPIWETCSEKRRKIMEVCLSLQPGLFYKLHGKEKPEYGLDCAGYVKWIMKTAISAKVPDMCGKYFRFFEENDWEPINIHDMKPGDIGVKNDTSILNHCGIYAGNGLFFDTSYLYGVQLSKYEHFKYAFRIKHIDEPVASTIEY